VFKFFHLSDDKIRQNKFTPRTPRFPYEDENGNVIEDDFTPRISVAPTILDAEKAIVDLGRKHLYAGDTRRLTTDDIPVYSLTARFPQCPSSPGNPYGKRFNLGTWVGERLDKKETPPGCEKYLDERNRIQMSPRNFPEEWRTQFYGCVPDALETKEQWVLRPVYLYYLGKRSSTQVNLSQEGVEILKRVAPDLLKDEL